MANTTKLPKLPKLPKLKWVKEEVTGDFVDFVVRDEEERLLWHVFRSNASHLWVVYDAGGRGAHRGYARSADEAKAIAQAFADSDALRGAAR